MKNKKDIILFVNDSYFSYLLSKELIESNYNNISLIIFSKNTTNSFRKIWKIFKKVPKNYFFYRLFVQILSQTLYNKKSVQHLAKKYNIQKCNVINNIELKNVLKNNSYIGFAFNFDMLFKENILSSFQNGIYNIHASKLPRDKGISPVLWAFARGDQHVWSTIYKMDEGLDSGPILKQIQIFVSPNDTSFSLYKRVCIESGSELNISLNNIYNNQIKLFNQTSEIESNYFSWPDKQFELMMKKSNRKFIKIKDLLN
jgi:methionyl-tRNA formyltransferase